MGAGADTMNESILLVDDDRELCAMLTEYLGREGFGVGAVHDGAQGVEAVRSQPPALVVMDITMPVMDGFDALRAIRGFSSVPVLMLTARGEELDRIVGLEIGADDYLPKPFNPRELMARIRAILRRGQTVKDAAILAVGDLRLDPGARSLQRDGAPIEITATEYSVLELLMRNPGVLVSKEDLSQQALGRSLLPFDRSLDTHISNLRRKLGPAPGGGPRIKTLRGRGYLLVRGEAGS